MVFSLPRSQIAPQEDPHGWNSYDHYRTIQDIRLEEHPFAVRNTLDFSEDENGELSLSGFVICQDSVLLEVENWFDVRYSGRIPRVRCHTFRYIAWMPGEHLLLKYHNLHRDANEHHHRVYNPATGEEVFHEALERYQFPTLPEVLDELEVIARYL